MEQRLNSLQKEGLLATPYKQVSAALLRQNHKCFCYPQASTCPNS